MDKIINKEKYKYNKSGLRNKKEILFNSYSKASKFIKKHNNYIGYCLKNNIQYINFENKNYEIRKYIGD